MKSKKGNLIVSDVIFLILAVMFIVLLFVFVARQSSNVFLIEQKTAKEVALIIDSAKHGMEIKVLLDGNFIDKAKEFREKPIVIDNVNKNVIVKLNDKPGYSGYRYGFFNNVNADARIDGDYLIMVIR